MSTLHETATCDPDIELVRACQAGGPGAAACFARLVRRHSPSIKRRAARILGDESDAEDIVQDVFVNVHRFLDRYQPDRPFSHWLSVVTLNACRIELRRRAGRDRRHDAFRADPGIATTTTENRDPILQEWLDLALLEFDPVTRQAILLRAIDGMAFREIADACGISLPATKMRVLRGLRDLRTRFTQDSARLEKQARAAQPARRVA